ncbi:MAG: hypothetical protein LBD44_00130 [Spirochaetaceae bacterium]|jgi:hypothetical protein|nr:hypothetical protein [Spirochaetaceae bacterium]
MSKYILNFSHEDGYDIVANYDNKKALKKHWFNDLSSYLTENSLTIDDGTGYFQALNKDGDYDEVTLVELFGRKRS